MEVHVTKIIQSYLTCIEFLWEADSLSLRSAAQCLLIHLSLSSCLPVLLFTHSIFHRKIIFFNALVILEVVSFSEDMIPPLITGVLSFEIKI